MEMGVRGSVKQECQNVLGGMEGKARSVCNGVCGGHCTWKAMEEEKKYSCWGGKVLNVCLGGGWHARAGM